MAVDDAGKHVFVSSPVTNSVQELSFSGTLVGSLNGIAGADGLLVSSGSLFVSENTAGAVVTVSLANPSAAPQALATGLVQPGALAMTAGKLWVVEHKYSSSVADIAEIDPSTGSVTRFPANAAMNVYGAIIATSPGAPNTLFVATGGLSPGTITRVDVSGGTPGVVATSGIALSLSNLEALAVSADGTRLIPASGSPYDFPELNASTLAADGVTYPAAAYPDAVAVAANGFLAAGLNFGPPLMEVFALGNPIVRLASPSNVSQNEVPPGGLAFSGDGSTLFAAVLPAASFATSAVDDRFVAVSTACAVPTCTIALPLNSTTTTISALPATSVFGTPVEFEARTTSSGGDVPTGTIQYAIDGNPFGDPVQLDPTGHAQQELVGTLNVGDTVTAAYAGDDASSEASLTPAITPAPTALALTSSANPAAPGQPFTLTARVRNTATGITPFGRVQFTVNGAPLLAPQQLDAGGTATITTSEPSGTYLFGAAFSDDTDGPADFGASSAALSEGVAASTVAGGTAAAHVALGPPRVAAGGAIRIGAWSSAAGMLDATARIVSVSIPRRGTRPYSASFGTAALAVGAGHDVTLVLRPGRTAARLLARHALLHVRMTVALTPQTGASPPPLTVALALRGGRAASASLRPGDRIAAVR